METCGKFVDLLSEVAGRYFDINSGRAPGAGSVTALPDYVVMVPVVGQPLSSGRYYVVQAEGKHTGYVEQMQIGIFFKNNFSCACM